MRALFFKKSDEAGARAEHRVDAAPGDRAGRARLARPGRRTQRAERPACSARSARAHMQQTRYARGPDGKTRGFYSGWKQERKLLHSVRANAAWQAQQPERVRAFPLPPQPPARAELELAQPRQAARGCVTSPVPASADDDDTGEVFLLNDSIASSPPVAPAAPAPAPRAERRETAPQRQPTAPPTASELTEQLRAMCGLAGGAGGSAAAAPAPPAPGSHPPTAAAAGWLPMRTIARAGRAASVAETAALGPCAPRGAACSAQPPSAADLGQQLRALCGIGAPAHGAGSADARAAFAPPGLLTLAAAQPPRACDAPRPLWAWDAPSEHAAPERASLPAPGASAQLQHAAGSAASARAYGRAARPLEGAAAAGAGNAASSEQLKSLLGIGGGL